MRSLFTVFVGVFFLLSCSKENNITPQADSKKPNITQERVSILKQTDSFVLERDNKTQVTKLSLRKNAFNKDFLLFGFIARQAGMGLLNPSLTRALMTRVIRFRQKDKNLIMEESPEGHYVDKDFKPQILLGVFPIIYENDDRIVCEFNAGFNRVYLSTSYKNSPETSSGYTHNFTWDNVVNSYVDDVKLSDHNEATIKLIAQFPVGHVTKGTQVTQLETFEILYHVHPYQANPKFTKIPTEALSNVGFFETHPRLKNNRGTEIFAFKTDGEKPFVFSLSANTPADYVKAVEDGVLYWNKVAGKKIVDVKKAPEGVRAPNYEHNVIQWVSSEESDLAYFQSQVDPKTGEVLHAHVFLAVGPILHGKTETLKWVHNHDTKWQPAGDTAFMDCALDGRTMSAEGFSALGKVAAPVGGSQRLLQDRIRFVVAHEVGHVMGFRHNFAGNLEAKNYDLKKREELFAKYLQGLDVPENLVVGSTVMDYYDFVETTFLGSQIRNNRAPLGYDKKAMALIHSGVKADERIAFCTDETKGDLADCDAFDIGKNPVQEAWVQSRGLMERLKYAALESFVDAKASPAKARNGVFQLTIEPNDLANELMKPQRAFIKRMFGGAPKGKLLQVRSQFPLPHTLKEEHIQEKEWEIVRDEVKRIGKLQEVLPAFKVEAIREVWNKTFKDSKSAPALLSLFGENITFDNREWQHMQAQIGEVLSELPFYIAIHDINSWAALPDWWKEEKWKLNGELASFMSERVTEYLLSVNPESLTEAEITVEQEKLPKGSAPAETKVMKVKVPAMTYTMQVRKKAPPLLKGPENWGAPERAKIIAELQNLIKTHMSVDVAGFSVTIKDVKAVDGKANEALKEKVTKWFTENIESIAAVKALKP